jgi:uncharacterized membrane protein YbhN (UPF0104 family)
MIAAGQGHLGRLTAHLKAASRAPWLRRVLRPLGFALLLAGAAWSVAVLEIETAQLSPGLVLLNVGLLWPLILLLAAVTLRLTAAALDREIPFREALHTIAAANLAELLPLPGGAMVRGAALMRAGARAGESARMVTLTALLTLSMAVTLAGAALAVLSAPPAAPVLAVGSVGMAASLTALSRWTRGRILAAMVLVRIVSMAVSVMCLWVSFSMLGMPVSHAEAALYTLATTLGSTVSIVPGGFGVNEAVAAGLAVLISGAPAAAFLAVAANRALALVAGAGLSLALTVAGRLGRWRAAPEQG